ncbi:MAG: hypothetical protein ACR2G0_10315 [Chthoniobacterales bacterium]
MELLARYLTAVKFWLPKKQREDIAAELAVNLQAEIDDHAAELGRPLTEEELAALLKAHGSPLVVASRFQHEQRTVTFGRQLIGPVVFPFYWLALKVTLILLLIPAIVPALVWGERFNLVRELMHILYRVLHLALPTLFIVTLGFIVLDYCLRRLHLAEKWSDGWDPAELPSLDRPQVPRSSSIAGILLQSIFILWWLGHDVPRVLIGDGYAQIQFAPIWQTLHLPILLIAFACLAQHWINLVQPNWRWLPPLIGLLTTLASLIVIHPLLTASQLVSVSVPNGLVIDALKTGKIQHLLWFGLFSAWIGMLIAGAVYAGRLVWVAWQTVPRNSVAARPHVVPLI